MTIAQVSVLVMLAIGWTQAPRPAAAILRSEFIAPTLPTASAHASTIVETADGLVAAWFGGSREGAVDVGIWSSRLTGAGWTTPVEVASGQSADGRPSPCWNPVLFRTRDDILHLFYKVGPTPARWWGMERTSGDAGRTWSAPRRLPDGVLGPIKNKPLQLPDGTLVSPSSTESTDADSVWRVHFERSTDNGRSWTSSAPPASAEIQAIQPSLLSYGHGEIQAIGRSRSRRLFETWSRDGGLTWTPLALLDVPNSNAGIDAVTLTGGTQLLVYNPTTTGRTPLAVAISTSGHTWTQILTLETGPGEYSYPAVIQTRDGHVHITYTWQRRNIRHVELDPSTWTI
jgi:predicted neuraminidase